MTPRVRAVVSALGVTLLGVVAGFASAVALAPLYGAVVPTTSPFSAVLGGFVVQPGFGAIAALSLWRADGFDLRDRVRRPTVEGAVWILGGPFAYEALARGTGHLLAAFGRTPFAGHAGETTSTVAVVVGTPTLAVPVFLMLFVVMAPMEELLYRGAVHDLLSEGFGRLGRTVLGAGLFGLMHGFLSGGLDSVVLTGVAGVVFAAGYERTDNLVVPSTTHGLYWLLFAPA